ncbi:Cytochrome bo(3) ubiquinol oxidase subunit 4 [Acetobacteraceae bacterium EV16G]|uniref:Cytochrome bo(3) ubiquinol oxidase subunit 4 n=1 Tax=Sorlinia euscelidii TaxID=3081148 RepID=A0ABU7U460_9PROT
MTPEERTAGRDYLIGFLAATILTVIPFSLLWRNLLRGRDLLIAIAICGVIQVCVHFRYFLHVDFKRAHRDDLQLVLFTGLIVFLMVGGTIWVIGNEVHMMSGDLAQP